MINNLTKAEKKFMKYAEIRGGTVMFPAKIALLVIEECKKNNDIIYGIDVFLLSKDSTQPLAENELDVSYASQDARYQKSLEFINSYNGKDLYFEIVCEPGEVINL